MHAITLRDRHLIVCFFAVLLSFWSSGVLAVEGELTNAYCPVTTDEKAEASFWLDHDGQRVYFCCRRCRAEFESNPEPYLANLTQAAQPDQPADSGEADVTSLAAEAQGAAEGAHSHDDHVHDQPASLVERTAQYLGRFHPVAVHFPIALILMGLLAEIMAIITGKDLYRHASSFSVAAGAVGAVVAAGLGWLAAAFASYSGELASTLTWHRWLGIGTATVTVIAALLLWGAVRKDSKPLRNAYRLMLVLAAGLVVITSHLGATLIYGVDYFGL